MFEIICFYITRHYYNNPLTSLLGMKKTKKLVVQKFCESILHLDIETYVKSCNVYLALNVVCYKLYKDLQLLPVSIHY